MPVRSREGPVADVALKLPPRYMSRHRTPKSDIRTPHGSCANPSDEIRTIRLEIPERFLLLVEFTSRVARVGFRSGGTTYRNTVYGRLQPVVRAQRMW